MPFKVIEHVVAAGPGQDPRNPSVYRSGIADLPEAERIAKAAAEQSPLNGYNEENHHWWGRNEGSGARRVYHVEPDEGPSSGLQWALSNEHK